MKSPLIQVHLFSTTTKKRHVLLISFTIFNIYHTQTDVQYVCFVFHFVLYHHIIMNCISVCLFVFQLLKWIFPTFRN